MKRTQSPSVGIIDSQSVKTINVCEDDIGYDGGKKVKGRKRHIVVDTLGLLLSVVIHSANIHDSKAAEGVLQELKNKYLSGIVKIFADGGYRGELIEKVKLKFDWILEIVKGMRLGNSRYYQRDGSLKELLPGFLSKEEPRKITKDNLNQALLLFNWL